MVHRPSVMDESDEFRIAKGVIKVEDPTKAVAASFLAEGESYTIKWTAEGPSPTEKMTIRLMDDDFWTADDEHALIAKDVPNTGSFEWILPNDLPVPDKGFYISVEWSQDKDVKGQSANFEIRAHPGSIKPTITGCTDCMYAPTETSSLTWKASADVNMGGIKIELWQNRFLIGPKKIASVAESLDASSVTSHDWKVPFKLEGTFFYRVIWEKFPSVQGETAEFKIGRSDLITNVQGKPVDSTAPAIYGEQLKITWDAAKLAPDTNLKIELYDSDAPLGISFGTTWFVSLTRNNSSHAPCASYSSHAPCATLPVLRTR